MPSETRKLAFSQAELQAALVNYALRSNMKLPNANIEKIVVSNEGDSAVSLVFMPTTSADVNVVEFSQEHVAAGIILYCRSQGIPLPRDSRKVLLVENGSISMMMQVNYGAKGSSSAAAAAAAREVSESEAIAADQASVVDGPD